MKSVSDLGAPLVGVGLLYQKGYFQQYVNADGWQQERYERNDFYNMPLGLERQKDGEPVTVSVEVAGRDVHAQVWRVQVGRARLYLLDTNVGANNEQDQKIGDYLYGGDREERIKQELMLGIGGLRAVRAFGIEPDVVHMNEGHSAFVALERIRTLMEDQGLTFTEARAACTAGNVFTTHTPVPAGFDLFSPELMRKYIMPLCESAGIDFNRIMRLGRAEPADVRAPFNMAVFAARNSGFVNGVSGLHGEVSRGLFHNLTPDVPVHEIPIGHITNGVHARSWTSPEMGQLFDRYLGDRWVNEPAEPAIWEKVREIPDGALWQVHQSRRERLVAYARRKLRSHLAARGGSEPDVAVADEVLDPDALTIGFARRFATYKRATLLLSDPERLKRILRHPARPVQIVFAGKAHPKDEAGKRFIQKIVHFLQDPDVRRRMVFLEDYHIGTARKLVAGVDIWLNTPRRPLEASGTSGMKVVFNGGLNFSVLDGWWAEAFRPDVGWAIGGGEDYTETDYQDQVESEALYHTLETEIVPLFYNRDADGLPREWIARMKAAVAHLGPVFNTNRMVREYFEKYYLNAASDHARMAADGHRAARAQARWQERIYEHWDGVSVDSTEMLDPPVDRPVGSTLRVRAVIHLGGLMPGDVAVEAYAGPADERQEITRGAPHRMEWKKDGGSGRHVFEGLITCVVSGQHGFLVRVRPYLEGVKTMFFPVCWEKP
jgi:starch phosphorylase